MSGIELGEIKSKDIVVICQSMRMVCHDCPFGTKALGEENTQCFFSYVNPCEWPVQALITREK